MVSDDLAGDGGTGAAKRRGGAAGGSVAGAAGIPAGGTGEADDGAFDASDESMLLHIVVEEVKKLQREHGDMKSRVKKLTTDLDRMTMAGNQVADNKTGMSSRPASVEANESAARRAEDAAKAAEDAATAAAKLKQELEDILRAIEVPSPAAMGGEVLTDGCQTMDCSLEPDGQETEEAVKEYLDRQVQMESRLDSLEEQIDQAASDSEGQVFAGLKHVMKDVRRCLSRCELVFQLPEIKVFIKRFQRSLALNAILHEKWIGPGAGKRSPPDGTDDQPSSAAVGETLVRNTEHARSASELTTATQARRAGNSTRTGKRSDPNKKKPFRTVVDWVRPHTPLKVDPVSRAHTADVGAGRGGGDDSQRLPPLM